MTIILQVHISLSKPHSFGPAFMSAYSYASCFEFSQQGLPSCIISYLPSVPSCTARSNQSWIVVYGLLSVLPIPRIDPPSFLCICAMSLSQILGSVSILWHFSRYDLLVPGKKPIPLEINSFDFTLHMRCTRI